MGTLLQYRRRTLNCGHLDLVQAGIRPLVEVGDLATCHVCPRRPDRGMPGESHMVASVRMIVKIDMVQLRKHPQPLDPHWWY